jgi:uncharacterized protein YjdB
MKPCCLRPILTSALLVTLFGCGGESPTGPVPVASISVSIPQSTLIAGNTAAISATAFDGEGHPLTGRTITWHSSDESRATISGGVVTGLAPGQITITATSEGKSDSAPLTILPAISSLTVSAVTTIYVGSTQQVEAIAKDADGTVITGRVVTWSSSDIAKVTVSPSGLLTAVAAGEATITAASEKQSASFVLTVLAPVASLSISPASATVAAGAQLQLAATLKDSQGNVLSGRGVTWSSFDPARATVSNAGLVSGLSQGGVTITASSEGKSATAALTILPPTPSLTVSVSGLPAGSLANVVVRNASGGAFRDSASLGPANPTVTFGALAPGAYCIQGDTALVGPLRYAPAASICTNVSAGTDTPTSLTYQENAAVTLSVVSTPSANGSIDINKSGSFVRSLTDVPHSTPFTVWLPLGTYQIVAQPIAAGGSSYVAAPASQSVTVVRGGVAAKTIEYATAVGGIISTNTSWSLANSPYRLTSKVQVAYGATLTIQPGVVVHGANQAADVFGTLTAIGTAAAPIKIDSLILGGGTNSPGQPFVVTADYIEFTQGHFFWPTGNAAYGSFSLRNSIFVDVGGYSYVWYPVADCYVEKNIFLRSGGFSVGTDGARKVYIKNNLFVDQLGGYAVENWASYSTSETVVERNSFTTTAKVALRLPPGYTNAKMTATNNFWNTTDRALIAGMIFDKNDDLGSAATIVFDPFLSQADPQTPAQVPSSPRKSKRP